MQRVRYRKYQKKKAMDDALKKKKKLKISSMESKVAYNQVTSNKPVVRRRSAAAQYDIMHIKDLPQKMKCPDFDAKKHPNLHKPAHYELYCKLMMKIDELNGTPGTFVPVIDGGQNNVGCGQSNGQSQQALETDSDELDTAARTTGELDDWVKQALKETE